jgi:hypothetical protein
MRFKLAVGWAVAFLTSCYLYWRTDVLNQEMYARALHESPVYEVVSALSFCVSAVLLLVGATWLFVFLAKKRDTAMKGAQ